jgi:hypothetical protein
VGILRHAMTRAPCVRRAATGLLGERS